MRKPSSKPTRLNAFLDQALENKVKKTGRSKSSQANEWMNLGRMLDERITGAEKDSLLSGTAKIKIEIPSTHPLSMEAVAKDVLENRNNYKASTSAIQYESHKGHPGYIVQIDQEGKRTVGKFVGRKFIAEEPKAS